jgi:uncharacterized protein YggE
MPRSHRTRRAIALGIALTTAALVAAPAGAQTPAALPAPNTITVNGSAQVEPKPRVKTSNASIKKAVAAARAKAVPRAIANGRQRAESLAQLSGIPLGALISIAEAPASPFFYPGPFGEDGSFGPGEYCGKVRRAIVRRDANGRRKVVGTRTTRVCRIPPYITSNLTMVFSTG